MSLRVPVNRKALQRFCRRWKITEFALFGSVLRDDFRPDSDVDVLVSFRVDAHWSLADLVEMQDELRAIFGRTVDLVKEGSPPQPLPPALNPGDQGSDLCGLRRRKPPTFGTCWMLERRASRSSHSSPSISSSHQRSG